MSGYDSIPFEIHYGFRFVQFVHYKSVGADILINGGHMGYQADKFKVKNVDLVLPKGFKIQDFVKDKTGYADAPHILVESDLVRWTFNQDGGGLTLEGVVTDQGLKVTKLTCTGEGSGHDYDDVLKPLFEEFKGNLEATVIWDSGQVIKISIKEGKVTEKERQI